MESCCGQEFLCGCEGQGGEAGRSRDHIKILPGAFVIVGDTDEEARAKRAKLDSLVYYESAIASLSIAIGHDASGFDPDAPLPDIPETNESKSGRERVIELARRENLTVRQLAQRLGGYSGLAFVGTPQTIADEHAGMAGRRRVGRVQRHVSLSAGRPRRFRAKGRP